jgi:hypothetical protein
MAQSMNRAAAIKETQNACNDPGSELGSEEWLRSLMRATFPVATSKARQLSTAETRTTLVHEWTRAKVAS